MFILFYMVMISCMYLLVHSDGETACDCSGIANIKGIAEKILHENKLLSARLSRLEEREKTVPNSRTIPVYNDRLEKLEEKVGDLQMQLNSTITTEQQVELAQRIDEAVEKLLMSETEERKHDVSNINKNIREHSDRFDEFRISTNNAINERFEYITSMENEHSQDIKDYFVVVLNNMTSFQENIIDDVNSRLDNIEHINKSIEVIETDLNSVNQSVSVAKYMIGTLGQKVEEDKDLIEQNVENLEMKFNNTITNTNEKKEGFYRNIGAIVKKTLYSEKKERTNFASTMNKKIMKHKESQNNQSHNINETLGFVLNNISIFQENVIDDVNRRIKFIATDLKTVNQSIIEALDKIVKKEKDWLPWSEWGECSSRCNAGLRERNRTCASKFGCIGNSKDFSICNNPNCEASVRLVNGSSRYEGRLEVFHNGNWGTVCDDGFTDTSAAVVCRELNLPIGKASQYQAAHFGMGILPIMLDDVACTGKEVTLSNCPHLAWGIHNCGHTEDVGISCRP